MQTFRNWSLENYMDKLFLHYNHLQNFAICPKKIKLIKNKCLTINQCIRFSVSPRISYLKWSFKSRSMGLVFEKMGNKLNKMTNLPKLKSTMMSIRDSKISKSKSKRSAKMEREILINILALYNSTFHIWFTASKALVKQIQS